MNEEGEGVLALGPNDAVVIFREDGSLELSVPGGSDDDPIGDQTMSTLLTVLLFTDRPKSKKILSELVALAVETRSEVRKAKGEECLN